jgi:hypothetical protein
MIPGFGGLLAPKHQPNPKPHSSSSKKKKEPAFIVFPKVAGRKKILPSA